MWRHIPNHSLACLAVMMITLTGTLDGNAADPAQKAEQPAFGPGTATLSEAIAYFEKRVEARPKDFINRTMLGRLYSRAARERHDGEFYDQAEDILEEALAINPDAPATKATLANTLMAQHQFRRALELATAAYKADADKPEYLAAMGDAQWQLGLYDEADATYQDLYVKKPTAPVLARLAQLNELRGRPDEAVAKLRKAYDLAAGARATPIELAWYSQRIGEVQWRAGKVEQALESLEMAHKQDPDTTATLISLARLHAAHGRLAQAKQYCEEVLQQFADEQTVVLLADIEAARGETDAARSLYRTAQSLLEHTQDDFVESTEFPPYVPHIRVLADANHTHADHDHDVHQHDTKDAQRAENQSQDDKPVVDSATVQHSHSHRYPDAHLRNLSELYADRGWMKERALQMARRDVEERKTVESYAALGWALYRNGQHKQALEAMEQALKWGTIDAKLHYRIGVIQHRLGQNEEALKSLQRAKEINPHFSLLEAARLQSQLDHLEQHH